MGMHGYGYVKFVRFVLLPVIEAVLLRFQKDCVHTYRFRIVFARPHVTLQRRIRFENAVIPSVRMLK